MGVHHVLLVVDAGHGELALGDVPVVEDVVGEEALGERISCLTFIKTSSSHFSFKSGTWSDMML